MPRRARGARARALTQKTREAKEAKEAKFEDHKNAIAKESLQNERDVKELMDKAVAEVKTALESGKSINKLKNKY